MNEYYQVYIPNSSISGVIINRIGEDQGRVDEGTYSASNSRKVILVNYVCVRDRRTKEPISPN